MKMSEYLQKKQEADKGSDDQKKTSQDRLKELEEAERKAREIRVALRTEKKQDFNRKLNDFSLLGMKFRPWALNDFVIILFFVVVLVFGGLSFIPSDKVSSDVDGSSNNGGFFSKLLGGFTVKSVNNEDVVDNQEEVVDETVVVTEEIIEEEVKDDTNPVDFDYDVKYQDSPFSLINITNVDSIWYSLIVISRESFPIVCNVKHYVNDNLKNDESTFTVEAGNMRDIKIKELASDTVETLSKVKLEISCSDGSDSSTKNDKTQRLSFYFN